MMGSRERTFSAAVLVERMEARSHGMKWGRLDWMDDRRVTQESNLDWDRPRM